MTVWLCAARLAAAVHIGLASLNSVCNHFLPELNLSRLQRCILNV